jgi:hypothetical protein
MTSQLFKFLNDQDFINSRQNNKHFVFRNLDLTTPTWGEILENLNQTVVSKSKIKVLDNLGFVFFDAERMKSVHSLLTEIKQTTDKPCTAHCYISLLETSATFGRHNDTSDVFFWQVQGSTSWKVEQDNMIHEYKLLPNDLIYIPRFIFHDVLPLGPRAGISIGIDY